MDQERSTEAESTVHRTQRINLNILSPSGDKLTFNDYPVSTTIAEVKSRIRDTVETAPPPERQRLIYRGKPLLQESATLEDVLTREAVR